MRPYRPVPMVLQIGTSVLGYVPRTLGDGSRPHPPLCRHLHPRFDRRLLACFRLWRTHEFTCNCTDDFTGNGRHDFADDYRHAHDRATRDQFRRRAPTSPPSPSSPEPGWVGNRGTVPKLARPAGSPLAFRKRNAASLQFAFGKRAAKGFWRRESE